MRAISSAGERFVHTEEVTGSIPVSPTINICVYGLGLIGALVDYIGHADGFWVGVLGVLKAIIWPVFVVYDLLGQLAS